MSARTGVNKDQQYSWPPAAIEIIKAEWGRASASMVCSMLPRDYMGNLPTRSAVCGKANRLGLSMPGSARIVRDDKQIARVKLSRNIASTRRARATARHQPTTPVIPEPAPHVDDVARVTLDELTNEHCRFPVGNPGTEGFGFCGALEADFNGGKPYCPGHHARCRVKPTVKVSAPYSPKPKTLADDRELFRQPA